MLLLKLGNKFTKTLLAPSSNGRLGKKVTKQVAL
jgi:hypothetical protein